MRLHVSNKRKNILITITAFLVVIIGFGIWFTWTGSTKDIESVANQFKADSSWKLASDYAEPPRNVCLNTGACPNLSRIWVTPEPLTQNELLSTVKRSGWDSVDVEKDCQPRDDFVCPVSGMINEYKVVIYANDGAASNDKPSVSLFIEK